MRGRIQVLVFALTAATSFLTQVSSIVSSAESNGIFVYERDAWAFPNVGECFQSGTIENLLPEHKKALGENLNHVEYHLIEPILQWDEFYGVCYGFATTSMLASYDILNPDEHLQELHLSEFQQAQITGDLFSLDRLKRQSQDSSPYFEQSLLFYYMMLQTTDAIRQEGIKTCGWTLKQKFTYLEEHCKKNQPVLVCFNGMQDGECFGHGVVAYGVESGSWEWNGEMYDSRIIIYDSNAPLAQFDSSQYQRLYDKSQLYYRTEDYQWIAPFYGITQDDCELIGITDDINVINDKGILPGTECHLTDWTDVVTTNELTSPYTVVATSSGEALAEYPWFYLDGDDAVRQNFVSDTANSCYTIKLESPQQIHSGVYYKELAFQCDSQSGSKINYDPSGCVSISGEAAEYSLTMVLNDHYPTQWYDVQANGTASQVSLQKTDQGYLLTADDLHEASLTAKNLDEKTLVSVSTDAKSVLFRENVSGQLVASADLDGDGSYETELAKSRLLGDLNGDGTVNASDAALLLIAAAEIGAGNASGLTEGQEIAADVNYDYKINASDSASILIYAADIGAGSYAGTLAQYMRRDQS